MVPHDWGTFRAFTGEVGFPHPIRDHKCVPLRAAPIGDAEKEIAAVCQRPVDGTDDKRNNAIMSKANPRPTLTDVLRDLIEKSGLTLYRIGRSAGVDVANLRRFVRGEMSIRLDKADRLAAYLGLKLVPDPDAVPPEPTPENLARPMLARRKRKRKAN